jgi:hypothetical protein
MMVFFAPRGKGLKGPNAPKDDRRTKSQSRRG